MKTYDWIAQDKNGDIYRYSFESKYEELILFPECWDGNNRTLVVENFHKDIKQFIKMPGWKKSLINLSEYDFKIENYQLVRVDKKETEEKEVHKVSVRIFIIKIDDEYSLQMATYKKNDKTTTKDVCDSVEKSGFFVGWLGDWHEREFTI